MGFSLVSAYSNAKKGELRVVVFVCVCSRYQHPSVKDTEVEGNEQEQILETDTTPFNVCNTFIIALRICNQD